MCCQEGGSLRLSEFDTDGNLTGCGVIAVNDATGEVTVCRDSEFLDPVIPTFYCNAVQVLSGLNAFKVFATSTVSFPRFFSKTTDPG